MRTEQSVNPRAFEGSYQDRQATGTADHNGFHLEVCFRSKSSEL